MHIEHILDTGSSGQLKIIDNTDDPELMTTSMWLKSSSAVPPPQRNQIPWAYSIDSQRSDWKSFKYENTLDWELLGSIYVGEASTFALHLGETGTTELLGPTDLIINLYGSPEATPMAHVMVDGVYKRAVPYVNDNGTWKVVRPFVRTPGGWKELS